MWGCPPNHGALLGLAARGPTTTASPVLAGVEGLPAPRFRSPIFEAAARAR